MICMTTICKYCGEEYVDGVEEHMCEQMKAAMFPDPPTKNEWPATRPEKIDTWDYVIRDIRDRNEMGRKKYGTSLTPSTSEDMLQHAYEEALDLTVYLKTEILKRRFAKVQYQD